VSTTRNLQLQHQQEQQQQTAANRDLRIFLLPPCGYAAGPEAVAATPVFNIALGEQIVRVASFLF